MSNFKCKCCGNCCSNYLPLRKEEIEIMRKLAKKENKHPLIQDWYSICPFLNNGNKCDIYKNRPIICKEFTCYKFEKNIYSKEIFKTILENDFKLIDIRKEIFGRR